jgi:hypothetical protein
MRRFLCLAALMIAAVGGFVGCDKKKETSAGGTTSGSNDPGALVGSAPKLQAPGAK